MAVKPQDLITNIRPVADYVESCLDERLLTTRSSSGQVPLADYYQDLAFQNVRNLVQDELTSRYTKAGWKVERMIIKSETHRNETCIWVEYRLIVPAQNAPIDTLG